MKKTFYRITHTKKYDFVANQQSKCLTIKAKYAIRMTRNLMQ